MSILFVYFVWQKYGITKHVKEKNLLLVNHYMVAFVGAVCLLDQAGGNIITLALMVHRPVIPPSACVHIHL